MKDRKYAELNANDHVNALIAKFPQGFKPTAASISPDICLLKHRRIGYYFWVDDDEGHQYSHSFDYSVHEIREDRLYYQIMLAHIFKLLSDMSNKNLCILQWEIKNESLRSSLQEVLL